MRRARVSKRRRACFFVTGAFVAAIAWLYSGGGAFGCAMAIAISCIADWRLPDDEFLASFRLPGPAERCTELQAKNPLGAREGRILLFEAGHFYEIDGVRAPRSVTGLVHS